MQVLVMLARLAAMRLVNLVAGLSLVLTTYIAVP